MDKNQKLAINLFKAEGVRYMEVIPNDIAVVTGEEGEEYSQVDILFGESPKDEIIFRVRVDGEWFLTERGALSEVYDEAGMFTKDNVKDGELKKAYPHIINRAMEAVGFVLTGRFKKEK